MNFDIGSTVRLNNGLSMPLFGFGTYRATGKEATRACLTALEMGYRLIDTASMYGNEEEVGEAVRTSGIPREDIFVTTKLWNSDHGYQSAIRAFERSLKRLDIEYIDLYLIHWPVEEERKESWRALEKICESGRSRAVGVSNYMIRHLKEVLDDGTIVPAVDQVEFSPYLYQEDLHEYCRQEGIQLEAYGSLTRTQKFNDPRLVKLAEKYEKTPGQILLRWALQNNVIVIPKSVRKERIAENADVFDFAISEEDMEALNAFGGNYRTSWDPSDIG